MVAAGPGLVADYCDCESTKIVRNSYKTVVLLSPRGESAGWVCWRSLSVESVGVSRWKYNGQKKQTEEAFRMWTSGWQLIPHCGALLHICVIIWPFDDLDLWPWPVISSSHRIEIGAPEYLITDNKRNRAFVLFYKMSMSISRSRDIDCAISGDPLPQRAPKYQFYTT